MNFDYMVYSLHRYPVKSMAGEELESVAVTANGLNGDRAYALVDKATGKVGSAKNAKRFGDLLNCTAQFVSPPEPNLPPPPVRITMSNGNTLASDQPDVDTVLAGAFGANVSLVSRAPEGLMLEFAAGTLGGKFSETTELPVSSGAPEGTLFNYAAVHLVTNSTLQNLQKSNPTGRFAADRFRPNIVLNGSDEAEFPENAWIGRTLAIGSELLLRVSIPCPRCVITTLPRAGLPLDASILRTIAETNRLDLGDFGQLPCVGVYADVVRPGRVRRGDSVRLEN